MLGDIFGVIIPDIQKSLECEDNKSNLKEEADKLNEAIDNYNRERLIYNREWFPPPSYTHQIDQMKSDLNEKSISLEEKMKAHVIKFDSLIDKCNLGSVKLRKIMN